MEAILKIQDVKTIYTGGGIFQYIVALSDGTWAMFDDDDIGRGFVPVVDREPTEDDWRSEFFEEHDAGYLVDDEAEEFMCAVLWESTLTEDEVIARIMLHP